MPPQDKRLEVKLFSQNDENVSDIIKSVTMQKQTFSEDALYDF